jgi:aminoglycoside phosphotransferase (APT) family kinase protein
MQLGRQNWRVSERIHDQEPDTSELTVRALLSAECPQWSALPMDYVRTSGTDNAMWRLRVERGEDLVVRLPRRPYAAEHVEQEMNILRLLAEVPVSAAVRTPTVRHVGEPNEAFPHRWAVLNWLGGNDAWTARDGLDEDLDSIAIDLATAVRAIRVRSDVPAPERSPGSRGGPIEPLVQRLNWWLDDPQWNAPELIDVAAVRRLAAEALEFASEPVVTGFTHGDLIPGNLLIEQGRLSAIIDWGGAGYADTAQDLSPAWALFDGHSRDVFREAAETDEGSWIRARTFELEQAVGGVLYYVPRGHALGDVMARTLERILRA